MHSYLRGKFIVLDGNEGCGKSTQSQLLREVLLGAGLDVVAVRDPGATRLGEKIRGVLLDPDHTDMSMRCEMLLYMAARAQMMTEIILPALAAKKTVVCDRFVSSTLAYQLGGEGLTADEIRRVADVAIQGRWPDLTILLDMPPDAGLARVRRARDRIEQRPMDYHEQVRKNYLAQAQADPLRFRRVPAERSREDVHAEIMDCLKSLEAVSG
ncbi:MAG TPA: dTMP kinase [Tepidisphaeraceae bacterium]|jgi:dTMP kinase|nr:dTMP kinase [Tepidisphaeraceae bacterium]